MTRALIPGAFRVLALLICPATLWGGVCYPPQFADGETEARGEEAVVWGRTVGTSRARASRRLRLRGQGSPLGPAEAPLPGPELGLQAGPPVRPARGLRSRGTQHAGPLGSSHRRSSPGSF